MPDYRLPLPAVVDPSERRCVTIFIPDEPGHISAFWGFLWGITRAYAWSNDQAHTARDVALVWRDVWDDARARFNRNECGDASLCAAEVAVQLRQNGCLLEYSIDCENWITLYDPRLCSDLTTQPGPQDTPDLDECVEFTVTLDGGGQWLLPIVVSQGYTIEVSAPQGGWSGDATSFIWRCGDGRQYALGQCVDINDYNEDDPMPDVLHMALIARLEGGTYFNPLGAIYSVPNGTQDKFILFQANDVDLADNHGSINFTVKVCHQTATNPYAPGAYIWAPGMPGWTVELGTVVEDHVLADENGDIQMLFSFDDDAAFSNASPGCRHDEQFPTQGVRTYHYYPVVNGVQQEYCTQLTEFHGVEGWQTTGYGCAGAGPHNGMRFLLHQTPTYEAKNFEVNVT